MINAIPVLDKGSVGLLSTSISRADLLDIKNRFFGGQINDRLLRLPKLHMEIKCPLFVQLFISSTLDVSIGRNGSTPETYLPSVNDVSSSDLETSETIAQDIESKTEALFLTSKAYQMDGCDTFVSQVITPISVYNTILVSGDLDQWASLAKSTNLALPIEAYRKTIEEILLGEYDFLREQICGKKEADRNRSGRKIHNNS